MPLNPLHAEPEVDRIYAIVRTQIRLDTLIPTCVTIAREVEHVQGLKGPEKLALLQGVLRRAVMESNLPNTDKEKHLFAIDKGVPIIAEAIIFASKHPVEVQAVVATCVGCCWKKK
jgi:hypothetical protein